MTRERSILFGKLAIARGDITTAQASECFSVLSSPSSKSQGLWDIAVDRGYLNSGQASNILQLIDDGAFICQRCQHRVAIADFPAHANFVCPKCQSSVIIERGQTKPKLSAPSRIATSSDMPEVSRAIPGGAARLSQSDSNAMPARARSQPPSKSHSGATSFERGQYFGDYEIVRKVGRGGMGMVYEVKRPGDDRRYALKILLERASENDATIARFQREVKISTQLRHEGIVRTWDAGYDEQLYWMVMDFVEGRELTRWRTEPGRSIGLGIRKLIEVSEAVAYAHKKFIVHRDLKPANIMVTLDDDQIKICDFGLAKALSECSELTKTGDILGTPLYMAPEQAMGSRLLIGPPTDVWAIGVMLYEFTTGKMPFSGKNAFMILDAVARNPVKAPTEVNPAIPKPLTDIIMKCLEKEPTQRFRDAGQLCQALKALF